MAEESRQRSLGVLELTVGVEADVERALMVLRKLGLSDPSLGLRNAVGVALMHSAYLGERHTVFPKVTKGLLDMLSNLGVTFLARLATIDAYQRAVWTSAGALNKDVNEVISALPDWAARQEWLLRCAALGHTFAGGTPPPRVSAHLLRRIIGVLCLAGEETVASRLLEGLLSDVRQQRSATVIDPKTTLQDVIAPTTAVYVYEREGPDHQIVFRAIVTDTRGRRGDGLGRNKKQAAQNAALDFLQRHIPQALSSRASETAPLPARVALPEPRAHVLAVQRLRDLFGLPASATPLLSQALIHSSWAFEHRASMAKYRQQDNQLLGFVGAQAAFYEYARAVAYQIAADPPQEFAFRSLDNATKSSVFRRTGVASGLLLGAGQVINGGVSEEMGATAFQAIIGAVFAAKGFPDSLAQCWPTEWAPIWQIITQTTPRQADPTTLLQTAMSAMQLQAEYEFKRYGPDHDRLYQATLILGSEVLSIGTQVTGSPATTKTGAKHEASAAALGVLNRLARPAPELEMADATPGEIGLARFVLAHQAALFATSTVPLQRWAANKLFGLHLAASPAQLISWAGNADRLLDSRNTIKTAGARLEEAFRAVSEGALDHEEAIDTQLASILEILEQISVPGDLRREHLEQLVQLCAAYRCIGADDPDTDLSALADDWQILYRGRLVIPSVPAVRLTGRERAILDAAVATVLLPRGTGTVEVMDAKPLRVPILSITGPAPRARSITEMCALWTQVNATTAVSPVERGVEVIISTIDTPAEPGPITIAVLAALKPRPEPYQASVADLLHDLKNQVVAARQASAQVAENETGRLEQQLDARRHLDRAHTIVLQLRAATFLLEPMSDENVRVELGAFLRRYGREVLAWLPDNIALSTPGVSHPAHVAIDDRALTAILDNLVKNAAEAMPHGGSINLSWAADNYEAVIEVADDGPGLPAGTAQAFASGQRIHSTKPGGSGLGLLGVKSLLRRVGGQLAAVPVTSGTSWEITVPITTAPTMEDS